MKNLVAVILACSFFVVGCDKKNDRADSRPRNVVATTPNDIQRRCRDAIYRDNNWYDANNSVVNCQGFDSAINSNNLYSYDNQYCRNVRPGGQITYMVYIGGTPRCATSEYFYSMGYNGSLQTNNPYWIGYYPPYYAHHYYSYPSYYGYWGYGYNGYYGSSGGDDDYSGGEVLAAGLIGLGTGVFLGTLL